MQKSRSFQRVHILFLATLFTNKNNKLVVDQSQTELNQYIKENPGSITPVNGSMPTLPSLFLSNNEKTGFK
jgi:hypothetical protein